MRALRSYGLPLVAIGVPMGVVIGVSLGLLRRSASDGLGEGLVVGAVTGCVVALVIGTVDLLGDREAGPGESSGPRQATSLPVRGGPDLPDRITTALSGLPATIRVADVTDGHYVARTRMTWRSFGEVVTVRLVGDAGSPTARVSSRPVVPITLIDYGKGRQNVHRVADALRE